jgi:phosphopantetheine adenylyltransferase
MDEAMGSDRLTLLLLPPPPSILSSANTKAAYGPAIEETLRHIKQTENRRLDLAISVPVSWVGSGDVSRTILFNRAQKALALTYSLICATAANQQIELDCLGGIDARTSFLLPTSEQGSQEGGEKPFSGPFSGPFADLATFIESRRAYEIVYVVESEEGERLLKSFLVPYEVKHRQNSNCRRVPGGLSITKPSDGAAYTPNSDRPHTSVAVGGTFDHLHIGHKLLLTATALLAEPRGSRKNPSQTVLLTIGISGDELLTKKKFAGELEKWEERQQKVAEFLESVIVYSAPGRISRKVEIISTSGPNGKCVRVIFDSNITVDYVQISDAFGPTITSESISALVLSQETRSGGKAINDKRREKGWMPLDVFEIDILEVNPGEGEQKGSTSTADAFGSKISSTEIRRRIYETHNAG